MSASTTTRGAPTPKSAPDQERHTDVAFLETAVAYYAHRDVRVQRDMTDNGSCYRNAAFRMACVRHGPKHLRTRPYTNEKPERFIHSSLLNGPTSDPTPTPTNAPPNCPNRSTDIAGNALTDIYTAYKPPAG